jgi:asparaginyl-tRNA synthetase
MSLYHVDKTSGSDTTGDGSADAPYQTLGFALFTRGHDAKLVLRNDTQGPYEEPTQSSLKKAKKDADGLEKKRKKAEELAACEAQASNAEREKQEKRLEESKKIKLVDDPSLPSAIKVRVCLLGQRLECFSIHRACETSLSYRSILYWLGGHASDGYVVQNQ